MARLYLTSQFSSDPSKEYDFNETSNDFQVFSRENLIAQQKKYSKVSLIKSCRRMRFLQFLSDIIFEMGALMHKWRPANVPVVAD